jgi:glycerophosphoryl diester phosphodiesterase
MKKLGSFDVLKRGWLLFHCSWKPMAAYTVLVWTATLGVLSPSATWILNRLVAQSGELVIGNNEMLSWLLSPKGLLALVLWGTLALLGLVLQATGLIRIAYEDRPKGNWAVKQALRWLLKDLYALFRFCISAFLLSVFMLMSLAAVLGAIYFLLLGAHDINYYLSVKPSELQWALALGGLCFLLWASAAGSLLLRWIYALPLWLDGHRPFRATLGASWNSTREWFFFLLRVTGACLAVIIVVLLILESGLFIAAGFVVSRLHHAVHALFFTISVYLVLAFVLEAAVTFIGMAWGTCVLVIFYRDHGRTGDQQKAFKSEEIPVKDSTETYSRRLFRPKIVLVAIFVFLLVSAAINVWLLNQKSPGKIPLVIAHRAGALHAPENTLAALEIAIRQGADYAEIDVQRSRDGVVVVIHDADLMKLAQDPRRISETDYADLSRVDIGRKFNSDFTGERLARLSDFLQKASGRIKLMIELKYYGTDSELAKETVRIVREAGMAGEVSLMSLNILSVRQMQRLAPEIPVGYLSAVGLGRLTRLDVDFLAVSMRQAKTALLRRAGRKNMPVYVWTVNDVDKMLAMLELGVDGMITDEPGLTTEVIANVAKLLPAERFMLRFRHLWDPFREPED